MRVITGKFKKANLITVKGRNTRPTTDFLKEVMFSVTGNCSGKTVLDLFAGSGALGIEALSRGATRSVMVDMSINAIKAMRANILKLRCETECRIYKKKVSAFLNNEETQYDLIFMDPPYNKDLVNPVIELIFKNNILSENGKIIVERSRQEELNEEFHDIIIYDKSYGDSAVTVLSPSTEVENNEDL